jgi:CheY-like chemotaxis protein
VLPHLFEMFSQATPLTDRSQVGLGIGLALVRGLVELHGGAVEARSDGPGQGSEFRVRLPLAAAAPPAESALPRRDGRVDGVAGLRMLVVDDLEDSADSMARLFRTLGLEVEVARDGEQAVEMARRFRPDVVLLDIGLPELDGYGACRRIREEPWGAEMLLVAVTGWGRSEDQRRAKEAGFDHHLVKPLELGVVEDLLASWRRSGKRL